ncbi:MAG: hypothetical protein ONB44_07280 [candidate division KSB1 bacterium]|nr:hypothetical protein [candidate division KSB1 bacterium]MDZ7301928.1 hypothetical protein [candidate division KSB1 bacterium]MDZ7312333.1 hypothetical protein [candidate division KSB1 bacterium]
MPRFAPRLFTPTEFDRIMAAVKAAEHETSGEIVPYVVAQSDAYMDAVWRAALLFALLTLAAFVFVRQFTEIWLPDLNAIALMVTVSAGIGLLLVNFIPALKRLFAGNAMLDQRVAQRAAEAFIEEEVFNTRDRTGILIFLSLLERRVLILGDAGINAKVEQSEWNDMVQRLVANIRAGKPADGLIEAIHQCGLLLQQRGVTRRADDTDELADGPREENR